MPWDPQWRRADVVGVTARAIDVVVETGEAGPMTAIGINLPNDQRIRERARQQVGVAREHQRGVRQVAAAVVPARVLLVRGGSRARGEVGRARERGRDRRSTRCSVTDPAACAEHLDGQPQLALKEQYSALEETRADLVALYFMPEPKSAEVGLLPAEHQAEIVLAEYEAYARNALVAAPARARRHADRGRPHAQSPDDRALADRATRRRSTCASATARRTTSWWTPPRFATASAGCSARSSGSSPKATTTPRRRCSRRTASTSIRRCATRSSRASTG